MKYMILLYGSQRDYDAMAGKPATGEPGWTGADFAAMGMFMESFNQELAASGELVETRGLTAPAYGRRIRVQQGAPVVTDGPYAESEEVLAGYWIIECASLDRATEITRRLTEVPGPEQVRDCAYADLRPVAESRDELAAPAVPARPGGSAQRLEARDAVRGALGQAEFLHLAGRRGGQLGR